MSEPQELEKCPYCKRMYKRLNTHLHYCRLNPDYNKEEKTAREDDINKLEDYIEQKILGETETKTEPEKKKPAKVKKESKYVKKVTIDFWLTDLHGPEIGIFQKQRLMAKSRQFPKNLDLCGSVREDDNTIGFFGYMKKDWEEQEENPSKKRLIIKWFDSDSIAWQGTIEEMVLNSLSATFGSEASLPSFKMMISDYKYVVDLAKQNLRWPKRLFGEIHTFPLLIDEKKNIWDIFTFDEDVLSVGSDWDVLDGSGGLVAKIDEKVVNVGGKYVVKFYSEEAYKNIALKSIVLLFAMVLKFLEPIKNKLLRTRKLLMKKKIPLNVSAQETKLYRNPRALKR
jgi:glutaredoxin